MGKGESKWFKSLANSTAYLEALIMTSLIAIVFFGIFYYMTIRPIQEVRIQTEEVLRGKRKELESKTLSAKKLGKFLDESKENTQIIYRNLSRAADLISSFKQVAVDQTADTIRHVKFNEFLHEIFGVPMFKKTRSYNL